MLRQAGAIEARSQEQLLDLLVAASLLARPRGRRTAVVGGGGGRSVQSADACASEGLTLPPLPAVARGAGGGARARAGGLGCGTLLTSRILAGSGLSANGLLALMASSGAYDLAIANVGEEWFLGRPEGGGAPAPRLRAPARGRRRSRPIPVAVVLGSTGDGGRLAAGAH